MGPCPVSSAAQDASRDQIPSHARPAIKRVSIQSAWQFGEHHSLAVTSPPSSHLPPSTSRQDPAESPLRSHEFSAIASGSRGRPRQVNGLRKLGISLAIFHFRRSRASGRGAVPDRPRATGQISSVTNLFGFRPQQRRTLTMKREDQLLDQPSYETKYLSIGEMPGAGRYRCVHCHSYIAFLRDPEDQLPPCPNCGVRQYVKYEPYDAVAAMSTCSR
jgi:DNA-directed RNA polymerase subunit RPC12/RpoP